MRRSPIIDHSDDWKERIIFSLHDPAVPPSGDLDEIHTWINVTRGAYFSWSQGLREWYLIAEKTLLWWEINEILIGNTPGHLGRDNGIRLSEFFDDKVRELMKSERRLNR